MAHRLSAVLGFSELSHTDLDRLADQSIHMRIPRGDVLVRQGDPADELYITLSGRFIVARGAEAEVVAEIGPGEPIGELAFLGNSTRTATVIAARDSEVLMLSRDAYSRVIREAPGIMPAILACVARRLASATRTAPKLKPKPPRTVALLPVGESPHLPAQLIDALRRALTARNVALISESTLPPGVSANDPAALAGFLHNAEEDASLVVLAVDRANATFRQACLSQADELVLIAPVAGLHVSRPGRIEQEVTKLFLRPHRSVVLWRERSATPITGTAEWLKPRDVALHHHVALDDPADFARWGRYLAGTAMGFVLGGGGALGCAHLGVAKALREGGVPLDFFGGTSVGAAMAGALAMPLSADEVLERTMDIFVRNRAFLRFTFPRHGLIDHHEFDRQLRRHYGDLQIPDLPFNYFAVSASLTDNDIYVHREGPLWESIRASGAIPGILPPFITHDGDVLIDGAVADNVPVAVMRDMKLGPNVVVTFERAADWRAEALYSDYPTRSGLLRSMISGRKQPRPPDLVTVLAKTVFFSGTRAHERIDNDGSELFIVPEKATGGGVLRWEKGSELMQTAYRSTAELLEKAGSVEALFAARPNTLAEPAGAFGGPSRLEPKRERRGTPPAATPSAPTAAPPPPLAKTA
jgi:NTE family protein